MLNLIHVPRTQYRGSDKKKMTQTNKQNLLAAKVEDYLSEIFSKMDAGHLVIGYHEIARDLGETLEDVRAVASRISAGGNGITLTKP